MQKGCSKNGFGGQERHGLEKKGEEGSEGPALSVEAQAALPFLLILSA